jgi:C4-type Zn-finger protein
MSCIRCQGLMLEEHLIDMEAGYGEMWSRSSRCVNCGHRDDAVIQHHRRLPANHIVVTPSAATVQETVELSWESEMNPESVESLAA